MVAHRRCQLIAAALGAFAPVFAGTSAIVVEGVSGVPGQPKACGGRFLCQSRCECGDVLVRIMRRSDAE
ncbi:MAG: hypothetical protein CMJ85_03900 [Planctomycetes bacterium]|nr:hypothetical protein [Planctomycetota bacterium]